jgi:WhiB family redox-sensing transcriptional regulator
MINTLHWMDAAACKGAELEEFFGPQGETAENRTKREARVTATYCAHCPVRDECLLDSFDGTRRGGWAKHGVWGGTGEDERVKARRNHKRKSRKVRATA